MNRKILILCIFVFLFFVLLGLRLEFAETFKPQNTAEQLHQAVLGVKQRFNINALSLAVLLPEKSRPVIINVGTTKLRNNVAISEQSLFQVGSLTKTFTAVLVAQAVVRGKLALNDSVGRFLPQYPKWKNITVDQLVNQTSGIPDYDASPGWWKQLATHPHKVWSPNNLVQIAYQAPENFKPGRGWAYSNTNYVLLGMILSKVNGKTTQALMANLFRQAKLKDTYFLPVVYPESIMARMAHGYFNNQYDQTQINGSWGQTAGAIVSNPKDLVRWLYALFNNYTMTGLPITNFTNFISTDTGQPIKNVAQTVYSFGVFRMNTPEGLIYFTPGLTSGYTSMMVYVPCLGAYFAYSATRAPMHNFHEVMMTQIMKVLKHYNIQIGFKPPAYCKQIKPAAQFQFPKIG